jgi:hypothetical protein
MYVYAREILNYRLYALKEKIDRLRMYEPEYGQDITKESNQIAELESAIKILKESEEK